MLINSSIAMAVRHIVTRITDIVGIDRTQFALSDTEFAKWDRGVAFVIYNSIHFVLPLLEEITDETVELVLQRGHEQENIFIEITVAIGCAVIISFVLLLPFIYSAHNSAVAVFSLFLRLPKKDIFQLVKSAEKYLLQVNQHFSAIVKHFNEIDFRDEVNAEKEAIIQAGKASKKELQGNAKEPSEETQSLTEETTTENLNTQLEELEIKRKESIVRAASTSSRNKLMVQIVAMMLVFAVYFVISLFLRISYFGKMETIVEILDVLAHTKPLISEVLLFAIEDFSAGQVTILGKEGEGEFKAKYTDLLDNELARELLEGKISSNFPSLSEFMHTMDTSEYCNKIEYDKEHVVSCELAHHGILTHGLQNCLNTITVELNIIYYQFLNAIGTHNTEAVDNLLKSSKFIDLLDVNSVFLSAGTRMFTQKIDQEGVDLFAEASSFDTYDFVVFSVLLSFIFLIALQWFLNSFKQSLWKTKRMLGILPTKDIAGQLCKIKSLIKKIS